MAEVQWIKITTTMFEDEKIDFIESLPEADAILIVWIKLLTLAGRCNVNGFVFLTENIAYTEEMLAHRFKRPLNTVKFAIETLRKLNMIENQDGFIRITNWDKHQNIEGLDKIREQNRLRQAKYRENQKLLAEGNENSNVTVTLSNGTDIELEEEIEIDIEEDKEEDKELKPPPVPYEELKDLFNNICKSYSSIRTVSSKRKTHIKARWNQYKNDIEVFKELFILAEESNFLKGQNDRKWKADFDWLINDNNMAKVLEGRYKNKGDEDSGEFSGNGGKETKGDGRTKIDLSHIGFQGTGEIDDSDLI